MRVYLFSVSWKVTHYPGSEPNPWACCGRAVKTASMHWPDMQRTLKLIDWLDARQLHYAIEYHRTPRGIESGPSSKLYRAYEYYAHIEDGVDAVMLRLATGEQFSPLPNY